MPHYESADALATSHFSHRALLGDFDARVANNHSSFAILLTRIAEIDERRAYLDEGYPSMKAFLVRRMKLPSESSAFRRLTAARTARKYPALLMALFEGRLHLRGVLTLAPHLTPANADELVAAALDKTCFELEVMLAERFPRPDLPERLDVIAAPLPVSVPAAPVDLLAARRVVATIPDQSAHGCADPALPLALARVFATIPDQPVHGCVEPAPPLAAQRAEGPRPRVVPLAPRKFGFQFTGDSETRELYEDVRALMSHEVPLGDMALVFKAALKIAKAQLEKRKFATTDRPGTSRCGSDTRNIPASVKRAVFERDQGQCAFVSETGRRCGARHRLEFDHRDPVARGGTSTVENVRLLCRAHNQHAAERAYGSEFMNGKRREAGCTPR